MIDLSNLISFESVVNEFGSQAFNMASVLDRINDIVENDSKQEIYAIKTLDRYKLITDFRDFLKSECVSDTPDLETDDFFNVERLNAVIVAFAVSDLSKEDNLEAYKNFIMKLVKSKKYDCTKLKTDCSLLLGDDTELDFHLALVKRTLKSELSYTDLIPLFLQNRRMMRLLCRHDAEMFISEIEKDLSEFDVKSLLDIVYNISKKKALSEFVQTKDRRTTLQIFKTCFAQLLEYGDFDIYAYVDDACDSIASLEEVIS